MPSTTLMCAVWWKLRREPSEPTPLMLSVKLCVAYTSVVFSSNQAVSCALYVGFAGSSGTHEAPEAVRLDVVEAWSSSIRKDHVPHGFLRMGSVDRRGLPPANERNTVDEARSSAPSHSVCRACASLLRGASWYSVSFLPRAVRTYPLPYWRICPLVNAARSAACSPLLATVGRIGASRLPGSVFTVGSVLYDVRFHPRRTYADRRGCGQSHHSRAAAVTASGHRHK